MIGLLTSKTWIKYGWLLLTGLVWTACTLGGSSGNDNPTISDSNKSVNTLEITLLDSAGNSIKTSGEITIFENDHNPITNPEPLYSVSFSEDSAVVLDQRELIRQVNGDSLTEDTVTLVINSDENQVIVQPGVIVKRRGNYTKDDPLANSNSRSINVELEDPLKYENIFVQGVVDSVSIPQPEARYDLVQLKCEDTLSLDTKLSSLKSVIDDYYNKYLSGDLLFWYGDDSLFIYFDSLTVYSDSLADSSDTTFVQVEYQLEKAFKDFFGSKPNCVTPVATRDSINMVLNRISWKRPIKSSWIIISNTNENITDTLDSQSLIMTVSDIALKVTPRYVYIPGTHYLSDYPEIRFDNIPPGVYPVIYADSAGNTLWRSTIEVKPDGP